MMAAVRGLHTCKGQIILISQSTKPLSSISQRSPSVIFRFIKSFIGEIVASPGERSGNVSDLRHSLEISPDSLSVTEPKKKAETESANLFADLAQSSCHRRRAILRGRGGNDLLSAKERDTSTPTYLASNILPRNKCRPNEELSRTRPFSAVRRRDGVCEKTR